MADSDTTKGFALTDQPIEAGTYPSKPTISSIFEEGAKITVHDPEHNSGSRGHWDAWYGGLPSDLKRKLSLHDFKRLGEAFKAAFMIDWQDAGRAP